MNTKSLLSIVVAVLALFGAVRTSAQPGSTLDEVRALAESPDKLQRVACVNNLKQLGDSFRIWAANNTDLLPSDILSMSNEVASTKVLICPADTGRQPANDWGSFTAANLSYKCLALSARIAAPQEVVLLCPIHGNVLLMDGRVHPRVARTHPEQFILKDGKLYFGEPVTPARFPITMTATDAGNPMTSSKPTASSGGTPSIRMDDQMMLRYGLLPPTAMPMAAEVVSGAQIQPQAGLKSVGGGQNTPTESETLERNLKDKDPMVRRAAIEKLARDLSEGAQVRLTPRKELLDKLEATQNYWAGLLADSLKDEDNQVRTGAASALYMCGLSATAALPQLLDVLQGTDLPLKVIAAHTLGNLGTNAAVAVPALEEFLTKAGGGARTAVAQALWRITRKASLVLPALIEALEIRTPDLVETWADTSAAQTLAEIGPEAKAAVPALSRLLQAKDQRMRVGAAAALVRINPDTAGVAEALSAGLQQDPSLSYIIAQRALCELGEKSIPVLMTAASQPSAVVRRLAIETLGSIGAHADGAVPLLAAKLADPDESVRRAAANALGKMAAESKAAVPQLRTALKDTSRLVRTAAAVALIQADPPASEAVPVLLEAISDRSDMTAVPMAYRAPARFSPTVVPAVLEFLKGASPARSPQRDVQKWVRTREAAIELLGRMGPNAQAAVPALTEALENKRTPHRREVTEALGLIGPDARAAVPALKSALEDQDAWVRLNAAIALARIERQDESHVVAISRFLKDQDASIRASAADSLGGIGARARSAVPGLRQLAIDDDDESVLRAVIRAVEAIELDTAKPVRE